MAENKILRELAKVPAGYGIDREAVKGLDKEKTEDFKKLIRILQDDNYRLEEERAQLKQSLRQRALNGRINDQEFAIKVNALKDAQKNRVVEFIERLLSGQATREEEPHLAFDALKVENKRL
jgi:hypothetical protein